MENKGFTLFKVGDELKYNSKFLNGMHKDEIKEYEKLFNDEIKNIKSYIFVVDRIISLEADCNIVGVILKSNRKKAFDYNLTNEGKILHSLINSELVFIKVEFEGINNNLFCSCGKQVKKHVYISSSMEYDICTTCKKEIK
jgi:hypothetical protein